ncbi:MAG: ABC transporter ATP-binding protein [Eubacteriales bacterium]|nr:ABC transporter ATP-binding protein [Eubacteriales bacterium]
MNMIETVNVQKRYQVGEGVIRAVDGIDLTVPVGEFLCISGRSGSGKSTLLSLLAGLEGPTDGEVLLLGEHMERMDERQRSRFRREHIGFVFQSYNLLPQFCAWENVALPLEIRGVPLKERRQRAMEVLELVGLKSHAGHRPTELSGGQQQRIGIARAIITRPDLVFADEPTGNLDTRTGQEIMELLRRIFRQWGTTFLLVSHDEDMRLYTDREIRLRDGKIDKIYLREEERE